MVAVAFLSESCMLWNHVIGKEPVIYFERHVISCVLNCNSLSLIYSIILIQIYEFHLIPHHNHSIIGDILRIGMGENK